VTGDQKKRREHDGRRRSRGAAARIIGGSRNARPPAAGGMRARGGGGERDSRKPETVGKRWKAPSLARFRSDQDDACPQRPRTPRRRRPAAHARTAGPERHVRSGGTPRGPGRPTDPIDLGGSDPIRYPPSSAAAPCCSCSSRVGRSRSSDRWLALRPRKLWCGANRPRDAGAEERAKAESGCRSNNQRARRLASPPPPRPLPHR
jgi:hypothetical protein